MNSTLDYIQSSALVTDLPIWVPILITLILVGALIVGYGWNICRFWNNDNICQIEYFRNSYFRNEPVNGKILDF